MKVISAPPRSPPKPLASARRALVHPNEGCASRCAARRRRASSETHALLASVQLALESLPVRAIRGRLGDVVFKTYGRKIIVTRVPCFRGYVPTAAQRTRRDRMREATAYAQRVYADPAARAFYTAVAKTLGRQPFRLAVGDYLRGHERVRIVAALWGHLEPERAVPLRAQPPRTSHRRPRRASRRAAPRDATRKRRRRGRRPQGILGFAPSVAAWFTWRFMS